MTVDEIFKNFKDKINQEYEKDQKVKTENDLEIKDNNSNTSDDQDEANTKNLNKIFSLSKQTFYDVLLNIKPKENKKPDNKNIKSLNFASNNVINNSNDLDENLNINNLVNINSERNNLIEENTLSLYNVKDSDKTSIKGQKLENTSMISEVKLKEKFEIRIANPKNKKLEENKEATNDRISSSSLIEKEKNLNDILELISSNSSKYIENKKIMENSKESESSENIKKIKLNKLALIDKGDS